MHKLVFIVVGLVHIIEYRTKNRRVGKETMKVEKLKERLRNLYITKVSS